MFQKLITFVAFVATVCSVQAESLTVADVVLPQNGTASIEIELNNPSSVYNAFTFAVQLPSGLSPVMDGEGYPSFTKGERMGNKNPQSGFISESNQIRLALLTDGTAISGTSGLLLAPVIQLSGTVPVGTEFTVRLVDITFTTTSLTKENLPDVEFKVTVGEPDDGRIVLDENSTTAPEASNGAVDVRVKRTITAGNWSTICLPFDMTKTQAEEIFGNDVEFAYFASYDVEKEDDSVTSLTINFTGDDLSEDGFCGNYPYLIKTSKNITEFILTTVIDPDVVQESYSQGKGNNKKSGKFLGTYRAETTIPENSLFLSSNKFWYSDGTIKMKAYRAYFTIDHVLSDVNNAGVKMSINIDGEATHIETLNSQPSTLNYYDLSGRKITKPQQRGIYIVNGKKVIVK